ncbi:DUF6515 family protein [Halioxenophilus sp. WMMB6]|uniref:DUF6515 family protein n=1 Tax=Halioxenophilus sp. WMMB6 TaxID=3073815 RepID=UPI00295EB7C7|nr:DUF6515 family protein [Halioxenophilus sp. WMMB6]
MARFNTQQFASYALVLLALFYVGNSSADIQRTNDTKRSNNTVNQAQDNKRSAFQDNGVIVRHPSNSSHNRDNNRNDSHNNDRQSNYRDDRRDNQTNYYRDDRRDSNHNNWRDDRRDDHRDSRTIEINHYHYSQPGYRIQRLPVGVRRLYYQPYPLYFYAGTYYRPYSGGFMVISAPLGVRVGHLPVGYISFTIGSNIYYRANNVYYRQYNDDYIVVANPYQDSSTSQPDSVPIASTYSTGDWMVYPNLGQSDDQLELDRYQCHRWAREQTGYDPSQPNQDNQLRGAYYRAQAACLEGRGYVVR